MVKQFFKKEKKEIDPEKMKRVNKILRGLICEQWVLLIFALPLSFLGSLQEFTTPFFIGKILGHMEEARNFETEKSKLGENATQEAMDAL